MKAGLDFWDLFAATLTEEWRAKSYCMDNPHEDIFLDPDNTEVANEFCDKCPVRVQCLDDAFFYEDEGHRGGMSEAQRKSIFMHRRRHSKAFQFDLGMIDA